MTRMLAGYIVGPTLGEGGFSKVKLGTHPETNEKVAIKILNQKKLFADPNAKKQVEREVAALSKIKHENVIRLLGWDFDAKHQKKNGEEVDAIVTILELANGGEMFDFLAHTGAFEEVIARTYFHQMIDALDHCFQLGVAHRDLKPENILMDSAFRLKIADFGFCASFENSLKYTHVGTLAYMAPEIVRGKGYDPRAADIWSAGVVLFTCFAGFPPYQKPDASDWWYNKLCTGNHQLFWMAHSRSKHFPDTFKDFINRLLNPVASARMTISDIRAHPWYTENVLDAKSLEDAMRVRKNKIDQMKEQQNARSRYKQARAKHEQDQGMDIGMGGVHRSVELESMPENPPVLMESVLRPGDLDNVQFDDEEDYEHGKDLSEVPVLDDSVAGYSRFETTAHPAEVTQRIIGICEAVRAKYKHTRGSYRVKARWTTTTGNVSIVSQVFKHPSKEGVYVVDFRRRLGDSLQFQALYMDICDALVDLIEEEQ